MAMRLYAQPANRRFNSEPRLPQSLVLSTT